MSYRMAERQAHVHAREACFKQLNILLAWLWLCCLEDASLPTSCLLICNELGSNQLLWIFHLGSLWGFVLWHPGARAPNWTPLWSPQSRAILQNLMGFGGQFYGLISRSSKYSNLLKLYLKAHLKVHPTTCLSQSLLNHVLETKKGGEKRKKCSAPWDFPSRDSKCRVTAKPCRDSSRLEGGSGWERLEMRRPFSSHRGGSGGARGERRNRDAH